MALTNLEELYKKAEEGNYGLGAFNVENLTMVQAVVEAAEELNSPVILQTTPGTIRNSGLDYMYAIVKAAADRVNVPIVLHLDHCNDFDLAVQALRTGYTSIMIDGSHAEFDENVSITKPVVNISKPVNVSVEAELGKVIGRADALYHDTKVDHYTDPDEARDFYEKTGVTSLAVSVGTAHGVYKGEPNISVERVKEIHDVLDCAIVLHGTSGVPDEVVQDCIKNGVRKVNYATDLRIAFTEAVKEYLNENPEEFDPRKYQKVAKEKVKEEVKHLLTVVGSVGKA